MLVSLDLETKCNVEGCSESDCGHALLPARASITAIGLYWEAPEPQFRYLKNPNELQAALAAIPNHRLVGHNLKFDLKMLWHHGLPISSDHWEDDTEAMATACYQKIPEAWLAWYGERRDLENQKYKQKSPHRKAGPHSLKTLAPYHLGVEAFWEGLDHSNPDYVYKDVLYTYKLKEALEAQLKREGSYEFYKQKLLPWTKMLLEAELAGIRLDMGLLSHEEAEATSRATSLKPQLDAQWREAAQAYEKLKAAELRAQYEAMKQTALSKLKEGTVERKQAVTVRYDALWASACSKLEPFSIDSPAQLAWLLRDYEKLDIKDFDGKDSTGKEVLQRLAGQGREDIKLLLEYRQASKLISAFFPSYKELAQRGRIHTSFHTSVARTGRTSSSDPNLQQVPGHLHKLFIADEGELLICRDLSGIEPVVLAYFTQDPVLCGLLIEGGNFHNNNVRVMLGLEEPDEIIKAKYKRERDLIKETGLSLCYGAGWRRLQASAQKRGFVWTKQQCQQIVRRFQEGYEGIFAFREMLNGALLDGPVTSLFGRKFQLTDPADFHLKGLNTLIQVSASDLLLNSAHRINAAFKEKGLKGGVRLVVHDEVVVAADAARAQEAETIVEASMTDYKLPTPYGNLPLKVEGQTAREWAK